MIIEYLSFISAGALLGIFVSFLIGLIPSGAKKALDE